MLEAITRHLRHDRRAVSNVIVGMLSLVLIVIIVGNVVLWSYQMNQLDLERIQESVALSDVARVTRSSWFAAQNEYAVAAGSRLSGSFVDTRVLDGSYESFREERTQLFNPSAYAVGGSTSYVSGDLLSLASNDDSYMSFRSYPNYELRYQESLETSSTTSTLYQDKVTIDFRPQVTADFIIIAVAEVNGSSTSYQARAQLAVNSTTYQELRYRVKDATDAYPFCGIKRLTLDGGSDYSIKIQFCTNNAAGTAYIRNARLFIASLQTEYAESEGLSTTSSTSWQDKATLAFTPSGDEDYLLIATANYRGSSTNWDVGIRLIQDDTLVHVDTIGRPGSGTTGNYYTFGVMRKVSLNASLHSFKIQYCSSGALGISGINYAHVIAIKLSQFDNNYYAEDESESVPAASNTWYDKVSNTYTADSGDHLILGSICYRSGSTSYSVGLDFQTGSVTRQSALVEHRASTTYESAFFMTEQTLGAGSVTDRIRFMSENTNARVRNARLVSCELPALEQRVEVEFNGTSNTQNWTQLEWAADLSANVTNVTTTFQLYDYQNDLYPTSGDGFMSGMIDLVDVAVNQTVTANPAYFRDAGGNWKVRVVGVKAVDVQFELRVDWVEFKATTSDVYRLDVSNSFAVDLPAYPLSYVRGVEVLVRYNVTGDWEKWFLRVYNWSASGFSDVGLNSSGGSQPVLNAWNDYAVNVTDGWMDYVSANGTLLLEFFDEGVSANQSIVELDFVGVRVMVDGARFELRNSSPFTTRIVALWIVNSMVHQRYSISLFINSGENSTYVRLDLKLPDDGFVAKVATEKGNVAVFP